MSRNTNSELTAGEAELVSADADVEEAIAQMKRVRKQFRIPEGVANAITQQAKRRKVLQPVADAAPENQQQYYDKVIAYLAALANCQKIIREYNIPIESVERISPQLPQRLKLPVAKPAPAAGAFSQKGRPQDPALAGLDQRLGALTARFDVLENRLATGEAPQPPTESLARLEPRIDALSQAVAVLQNELTSVGAAVSGLGQLRDSLTAPPVVESAVLTERLDALQTHLAAILHTLADRATFDRAREASVLVMQQQLNQGWQRQIQQVRDDMLHVLVRLFDELMDGRERLEAGSGEAKTVFAWLQEILLEALNRQGLQLDESPGGFAHSRDDFIVLATEETPDPAEDGKIVRWERRAFRRTEGVLFRKGEVVVKRHKVDSSAGRHSEIVGESQDERDRLDASANR